MAGFDDEKALICARVDDIISPGFAFVSLLAGCFGQPVLHFMGGDKAAGRLALEIRTTICQNPVVEPAIQCSESTLQRFI